MLSNTEEGKRWLEQFNLAHGDQEIASLLLDSLMVIDQADFEREMEKALDDFLQSHKGRVALYAAIERPKVPVSGNPWKKVPDKNKPFFPQKITEQNPWREAENFASLGETGSEGALRHFCRDYSRTRGRVYSHPGLETMRREKIRWIVCMDDVMGSGNRMKEFIEWMREDKTIRSWHSFGWIRIVALSYAASSYAHNMLNKVKNISETLQCQYLSEGRTIWSQQERYLIEEMCRRYAKIKKLGHPLGYKKAFSMILFSHGCPNTNPSVFWKKTKDWKPLVAGTGRPGNLIKKAGVSDEKHQERLLRILGQTRLTKPSLFKRLKPESRNLLVLLSCIARKKRNPRVLSEMLGMPVSIIQEWSHKCQLLGWINEKKVLTLVGKYALESAKKNVFIREYDLKIKEDFYFPRFHRSPAGSSSSTPPSAGGSHGC